VRRQWARRRRRHGRSGRRPLRQGRPRGRVPAPGRGPPGDGPAGMTWLRIRAVARRHAYVLVRSPHRLFDVVLWPLVDVLLFGSIGVFVARQATPARVAAAYLLAGILLWHVLYQSQLPLATGFLQAPCAHTLLSL